MNRECATCEVFVLVDGNGDYVGNHDSEQLGEMYDDQIGGSAGMPRRVVKVVIEVPLPVDVTLKGTVPDMGQAELTTID